jgi:NAD(P)-dependent dehydrogenase (short-subunit alcohol dehydrogenase family)
MDNKGQGELENKVAIVTGAQQGIGLATASRLAANGAKVVLADLPGSRIEEAAQKASEKGDAVARHVDITDEQSVRELVEFTRDTWGGLDILDNNAARQGLAGDTDILSMDPDVWDSIFAVNARGTMLMCKHAIAAMTRNGGSIINISSGTSLAGQLYQSAYACSKGTINTLTKYIATQYGDQGIRCNAIAVGLVKTEMLKKAMPESYQQLMVDQKLAGRLGDPDDIAQMVSFLASDRASWITGQIYSVDGGYFAHGPQVSAEKKMMAQSSEGVGV